MFAETNAPAPQRAAISESWKLIYYLNSNLYELYDLKKDPWEHDNLAPRHPPAFDTMKAALDGWLERVVFARDPEFNQANEKIKDVLLPRPVEPPYPTPGLSIDHGKIAIAGYSQDGKDFHVFFTPKQRGDVPYKLQLSAWGVDTATFKPTDPVPPSAMRSPLKVTAEGYFPSDRWKVGDMVRERFTLPLPPNAPGDGIALALTAVDPANGSNTVVLGLIPRAPQTGSSGSARP